MTSSLPDLLFWIVLLVVLAVGIRWLQRRNKDKD